MIVDTMHLTVEWLPAFVKIIYLKSFFFQRWYIHRYIFINMWICRRWHQDVVQDFRSAFIAMLVWRMSVILWSPGLFAFRFPYSFFLKHTHTHSFKKNIYNTGQQFLATFSRTVLGNPAAKSMLTRFRWMGTCHNVNEWRPTMEVFWSI